MAFLLSLAFVGLGYRLVDLQILQHDKFRKESTETTHHTFVWAPKRGDIRDVRGHLLAASVFVRTVWANPAIVAEYRGQVAKAIAPILDLPEGEIVRRLEPRRIKTTAGSWVTNRYVVLKNKVSIETCEQLQATMRQLPLERRLWTKAEDARIQEIHKAGVSTAGTDDQLRVYPNESLAAHVLGCVGNAEVEGPNGRIQQLQGVEGIELALDQTLRGVAGWRNTEVAKYQELAAFRDQEVEARPGWNVVLTIDSTVQHIVEAELALAMEKHTPISASAVVVRPRTGEILAMATLPTFNPNRVADAALEARRNRVIADVEEPGSTFKIVVISGALNDGIVGLDDKIDCENGDFFFAGKHLHDHERCGVITVEEVITHSSNIGAAKVGIKLGQDRLYQYVRSFGFGAKTGIPLLGEVPGLLRPVEKWQKISISRIPMGQEIAVTPLQMVMAMSAVSNNGRLMRPLLVDHLEDDHGQVIFRNYPQQIRQAVSERAAQLMVTALKTVVSTNGTGKKAMLEHYTVAGKTGTAQKVVGRDYRHDKHFTSFIGFFPADSPELCVAIFLDEPKNGYYAGEAAAPVFHDIAERVAQYLAIKADIMPPAPSIPAAPIAAGAAGRIAAIEPRRM